MIETLKRIEREPEFRNDGRTFGKHFARKVVTLIPMKRLRFLPVFTLCAALAAPAFAASPAARPETWAVAVPAKSVSNLWRVEPDLYRSARPESAGFQELEKLGVKAVLDIESPADEVSAKGTSLKLYHVPMNAFGLRDESVLEAMRILSDPANRPIVVHCQHGADRTGAMMALYRVVVQGWTKEDAVREMNAGGYRHSSWFSNLDRYVANADVDGLRKALKIASPRTPAHDPGPGAGGHLDATARDRPRWRRRRATDRSGRWRRHRRRHRSKASVQTASATTAADRRLLRPGWAEPSAQPGRRGPASPPPPGATSSGEALIAFWSAHRAEFWIKVEARGGSAGDLTGIPVVFVRLPVA